MNQARGTLSGRHEVDERAMRNLVCRDFAVARRRTFPRPLLRAPGTSSLYDTKNHTVQQDGHVKASE